MGQDILPGLTLNARSRGTLATRMGCANRWVVALLLVMLAYSAWLPLSYYRSSRFLSSQGTGCSRRWVHRISCRWKEKIGLFVNILIILLMIILIATTRSRNWTCPHCQQTNLELLPDPPENCTANLLGTQEKESQVVAAVVVSAEDLSSKSKLTEHPSTTEATVFETPRSRVQEPRQNSKKPHILLDTAICILLVLLFAIICRRIV